MYLSVVTLYVKLQDILKFKLHYMNIDVHFIIGIIGAAAQPMSCVLDLLSKTTEGANAMRMKIAAAITSECLSNRALRFHHVTYRNREALKRGLSSVCFYESKDSSNGKVIWFCYF
jgi:hypothetical protein